MAFSHVQSTVENATSTNSLSVNFTAATQGNLVVIILKIGGNTDTLTSVTDNASTPNTYAILGPVVQNIVHLYVIYGVQVTGGMTTVTLTLSGSTDGKRAGGDEFSGNASTNSTAFDKSSNGNGNGTSLSVTSFSPTNTGELIVAGMALQSTATFTAGTGYTLGVGVDPITVRSEYNLSGGASETAPATISGAANDWTEIAAAFKAPAASSAFRLQHLTLLGIG